MASQKGLLLMTLPIRSLPRSTFMLGEDAIEIRSLSRTESFHFITAFKEGDLEQRATDAENYLLSTSCDVTQEEAQAFRESCTADEVNDLITAILDLSGLVPAVGEEDKDPKSDGKENSKKND